MGALENETDYRKRQASDGCPTTQRVLLRGSHRKAHRPFIRARIARRSDDIIVSLMATLKDCVDKHDREISAIRKVIQAGMKILVRIEDKVDQLADSQRKTDRQLQDLIRALNRGEGNGHKPGRLE
jgi:hypothetical protein